MPIKCAVHIYMSRDLRFNAARPLNRVKAVSQFYWNLAAIGYISQRARPAAKYILGTPRSAFPSLVKCATVFEERSHACHQQLKGSVARQVECQGVATASSFLDDNCNAQVISVSLDMIVRLKISKL